MDYYNWIIFIFSVVIIYILCKISKIFRFYLKMIIFHSSAFIAALIFIPVMLPRPGNYKNAFLPCWLLRFCTKHFLGITYELQGIENILKEGQGCVVLCNHQANFDLDVLSHIWPYTPFGAMIAKKEILWFFPFGQACKLWGTVFVDRKTPAKAQSTLNETGELINNKNFRIVMFPEGTRNMNGDLLPFKKGGFHIAVTAQCPIQPIVVSRYYFYDLKTHKLDEGHNIIKFLPAIPTAGLSKDDIPTLMDETREIMRNEYFKITKEILDRQSQK